MTSIASSSPPVKSEIEWTPLEYRLVRNVAQETSVLVEKCNRSKEFASMFYRHHQNDLRTRIQDLTRFMHRAGKEKRNEKVLISKQILRLRQLMSSLQKENALRLQEMKNNNKYNNKKNMNEPSYSAPLPPPSTEQQQQQQQQPEKAYTNEEPRVEENALAVIMKDSDNDDDENSNRTTTQSSNTKSTGKKQIRSGPQKRMKPHERLFRQRTKSMIIAEDIEKRWGSHGKLKSPNANDKSKRNYETSLRGGRNAVLADEWRTNHHKKKLRSPKKNKKPLWNSRKSIASRNVRKPSIEPKEALYAWESGYIEGGSSSKHEEKKQYASARIDKLRKEANDPKFKMKKHNVAFGSKPTEKGAPRFDPKSLHRKTSYLKYSNNTALNSSSARVLVDFAIVLNEQEYETYKLLALGVPLEKSALQRQAVKEAAKHATKRLSIKDNEPENDIN